MRKISEELRNEIESLETIGKPLDEHRVVQIRKYRLVTPLFGGGVTSRENDPSKLIRETSVRGQLRFWWRAMRASGTIGEMKAREDEIFGSGGENARQSKLFVKVRVTNTGNEKKIFRLEGERIKAIDEWTKIAYAAFALQPSQEELRVGIMPKKVREKVEFEVELSFPEDLRSEVEAALWAWETFGGIGGRTRRGFGAIELLQIGENEQQRSVKKYRKETAEDQIREDLRKHLLPNKACHAELPHLSEKTVFRISAAKDVREAWEVAVEKLRSFRQFRRDKKTGKESPYGKSQWPEPDEIRRLSGNLQTSIVRKFPDRSGSDDSDSTDLQTSIVGKFPRAVFGLPIIFHFPQESGAIPDATLKPKEFDRLASPLILRPIACEDGAVAIALILETPRLPKGGLELEMGNKKFDADAELDSKEAAVLTKNGLDVLQNKTDVLEAFLDFFVR
jgi:CRISPR-associated protein Cmr1